HTRITGITRRRRSPTASTSFSIKRVPFDIGIAVTHRHENAARATTTRGASGALPRAYLKTFESGTPNFGAFGAQVSIDFKTISAASPMACPDITYGRYCSFAVWLSKYLFTKGAQLTPSAVWSSVHHTALKLKGRPLMATPEMTE